MVFEEGEAVEGCAHSVHLLPPFTVLTCMLTAAPTGANGRRRLAQRIIKRVYDLPTCCSNPPALVPVSIQDAMQSADKLQDAQDLKHGRGIETWLDGSTFEAKAVGRL
eukprot:2008762-Amphidinium_carterae.1